MPRRASSGPNIGTILGIVAVVAVVAIAIKGIVGDELPFLDPSSEPRTTPSPGSW